MDIKLVLKPEGQEPATRCWDCKALDGHLVMKLSDLIDALYMSKGNCGAFDLKHPGLRLELQTFSGSTLKTEEHLQKALNPPPKV